MKARCNFQTCNSPVQQFFDNGHATRHDVANDNNVGRRIKLGGVVTLDQLHAKPRELLAHRRVNIAIGTRNLEPCLLGDGRKPAHESATDSQDVYVLHAWIPEPARQAGAGPSSTKTR